MKKELNEKYFKEIFQDENIRREAFKQALDMRENEIKMYWRKAAFFLGSIITIFVSYIYVQGYDYSSHIRNALPFLLNMAGLIFTIGWNLTIRESILSQNILEKYIYYLEDEVMGPLNKLMNKYKPMGHSFLKIHKVITYFIIGVWLLNGVRLLGWIFYRNIIQFRMAYIPTSMADFHLLKIYFSMEKIETLFLYIGTILSIVFMIKIYKSNYDDNSLTLKGKDIG